MVKHEQQLVELERQYADLKKRYRQSARPLTGLIAARTIAANWRDRVGADRRREPHCICDEPVAVTAAFAVTASRAIASPMLRKKSGRDAGGGEGVWESMAASLPTPVAAVGHLTD